MNVQILNRSEGGTFSAQNEGYKLTGDYQRNYETHKLTSLNVQCYAIIEGSETYVGEARGHQSGDDLAFNLQGIVSAHLAGVASAVSEAASALGE